MHTVHSFECTLSILSNPFPVIKSAVSSAKNLGVVLDLFWVPINKRIATYYVKNHRQRVISAGSDWMRLAVIGVQRFPQKTPLAYHF